MNENINDEKSIPLLKTFNTITKSFLEVEEMLIPFLQYSILKKAIKCFKYLQVNGLDVPKPWKN